MLGTAFSPSHLLYYHFEILLYGRIGMMKGKAGVRHAGHLPDLTTQLAKNRRRHRPQNAAPGIDNHFEWTSQLENVFKKTCSAIRRDDFKRSTLPPGFSRYSFRSILARISWILLAVECVLAERYTQKPLYSE